MIRPAQQKCKALFERLRSLFLGILQELDQRVLGDAHLPTDADAAEQYTKLTEDGMSAIDAHYAVSRLLGHERADVTNIYLASVRKRGRDGE